MWPVTSDQKRARLRLIRRCDRKLKNLPLRRDFGRSRPRRRSDDDLGERDLDTPNPDLIGLTDDGPGL
jgi:hypothetical protein